MTKEKLDTLLANGAITQEEYDGLVQSIQQPAEPPESEPQPEQTEQEQPKQAERCSDLNQDICK